MIWLKDWCIWWLDRVLCAAGIGLVALGIVGVVNVWERGVFPF